VNALVVLGATGSIGRQTLDVADRLDLDVRVLAARRPGAAFDALAARYPGADLVLVDGSADSSIRPVRTGAEALTEAASRPGSTVVNGVVGAAGLAASVAALEAGNRLALANKESMVAAGDLIRGVLAAHGGELIPVDSEHSALFQCLQGEPSGAVRRLILTASGGPFRGWARETLRDVTPEQALAHPTWSMGARITIDSATLFNKGLEVIEAHQLFGLGYDAIDVVVHPQSIVHSLIEFRDGSLKAHMGQPDMRVPIQYALTYPDRLPGPLGPFDLTAADLTFQAPDRATFRALDLAFSAGRAGGTMPAVLNAADEVAVQAFLDKRLGFLDIAAVIESVLSDHDVRQADTIEAVVEADAQARARAEEVVSRLAG
jgi:1-deoxy-D-xylulose-5-phosphate reductoisomerase